VVGRVHERRRLTRALQAARARRGGSAFLLGERGIGKTRLLNEITELAVEYDVQVWRGRASAVGPAVPLRPLAEALLSRFRGRPAPDAPELVSYLPALSRLVPDWSGDDPEAATNSAGPLLVLAEAVLRLLVMSSRDGSCLLVLDDLQEADAETLFVVEYLVDNLGGSRVLLLGTARSGGSAAVDLVRAAGRRGISVVQELRALSRDAVCRLTAACLEAEPDELPAEVVDLMWHSSAGNPLVVEELVVDLAGAGALVSGDEGWHLADHLAADPPAALVDSVTRRVGPLGEDVGALLSAAAVFGRRFPLSVVQRVTGLADRDLVRHLRAALNAELVVPDDSAPDWYLFRHPLIAEAVLSKATPGNVVLLAKHAAEAVLACHPGLPGDWCALTGRLLRSADDPHGAATMFAETGRRALADGQVGEAVSWLTEAAELLDGHPDAVAHDRVLEDLVQALGEHGRLDDALRLAAGRAEQGGASRSVGLHTQLAWAANLAGRTKEGLDQVRTARGLLGSRPDSARHAGVDAVEASLLLGRADRDGRERAARLAGGALRVAERDDLPDVACRSLQVLGALVRDRDVARAEGLLERAREWAERHELPLWRTHVLFRLGVHRMLTEGDGHDLELARVESRRTGAATVNCVVSSISALHHVLSGEFAAAAVTVADAEATADRLRLPDLAGQAHLGGAILAAHRADRAAMEAALAEIPHHDRKPEGALPLGLAQAFCSLLEEDGDRARRELRAAAEFEERNHVRFRLSGRHGLRLLLDLLAGELPEARFRAMAATAPASLRWNRQFVLLGEAVLLGRANQPRAADRMADAALTAGRPYPVARRLGARLVAETAAGAGWGEPVTWLRDAEEYFHQAGVPAVASACRASLREIGAVVPQRRSGVEHVPEQLRAIGVTVREYDVLRLLGERMGNKDIARRLHISPRTVEKHVARLMAKTFRADRATLSEYAATQCR
jgi:hypothetical protein